MLKVAGRPNPGRRTDEAARHGCSLSHTRSKRGRKDLAARLLASTTKLASHGMAPLEMMKAARRTWRTASPFSSDPVQPGIRMTRCRPSTMIPTAATQLPPALSAMGRQPPTPRRKASAAPVVRVNTA